MKRQRLGIFGSHSKLSKLENNVRRKIFGKTKKVISKFLQFFLIIEAADSKQALRYSEN